MKGEPVLVGWGNRPDLAHKIRCLLWVVTEPFYINQIGLAVLNDYANSTHTHTFTALLSLFPSLGT